MIDLIKDALDELNEEIQRTTTREKTVVKKIEFDGPVANAAKIVNDLGLRMEDIWFEAATDQENCSKLAVCFCSKEPKDQRDKEIEFKFNLWFFSKIFYKLNEAGYKVKGHYEKHKTFENKTIYDLYINQEWNKLEEFFKMFFVKS